MKYFLDTEFIEGFHKPLFGKRRHFIDLISIGIVCEDGRRFYAISKDYNYKDADKWVQENVIIPAYTSAVSGDLRNHFTAENFHKFYGSPNKMIAEEVLRFMGCWRDQHFWRVGNDVPEIYGYYADYDWVLFCSLFGQMIDLPKGFQMYCRDLKQMLDDIVSGMLFSKRLHFGILGTTEKQLTTKEKVEKIKSHPDYPKQNNEHNALADAKWNYELYKFLNTLLQ